MSLKKLTVAAGVLGFVIGFTVSQNLLPAIGYGVAAFFGVGVVIAVWRSIATRVRARKEVNAIKD